MKFKLPAFLENIESPVEGEVALRKFAANPLAFGGDLDLFSAGANGARSENASYGSAIVVGIDEVGRGPLAGPVVACAAVLKSPDALLTLNDSKKLSRPKREAMFDAVKDACACYAIASASVEEIDCGRILAQTKVPVMPDDTADTLAARVLVQEHALYWKTIKEYAASLGL